MSFKVASVVSMFNAKSGGPPGTVALIAQAGKGLWQSVLFATDHQESRGDTLLFDKFAGQVNVLPRQMLSATRGLAMMAGLDRSCGNGMRRVAPDIVHIHGMWSPLLAAFAQHARCLRIPYIVSPHGMLEPWSLSAGARRKSLALRTYQGRILRDAVAIHTTSVMEATHVRSLGVTRAPIIVVPNIVEAPMAIHEDQTAPKDRNRVLLFLSRIHRKKGLDTLLSAWNGIRPPGWNLLIVGSGDPSYLQSLQHLCRANGIADVSFHPHAEGETRERLFRSASAFVLPTHSENFGNVVAEALIRGLPVITTTGTPWSELVPRRCGWYVEPSVGALMNVLAEATAMDENTLREMGARGRDYALAHFSLTVVRSALLEMYRTAMHA